MNKKPVVSPLIDSIKGCVSAPEVNLVDLDSCVNGVKKLFDSENEEKKHKFLDKGSELSLDLLKWLDHKEQKTYSILDVIDIITTPYECATKKVDSPLIERKDSKASGLGEKKTVMKAFEKKTEKVSGDNYKHVKKVISAIEKKSDWIERFADIITNFKGIKSCIKTWFKIAGNLSAAPHILSGIINKMPEIYEVVEKSKELEVKKGFIRIFGNAFDWEGNLCLTDERAAITIDSIKKVIGNEELKVFELKALVAITKTRHINSDTLDDIVKMVCNSLLPKESDKLDVQKAFIGVIREVVANFHDIDTEYTSTLVIEISRIIKANENDPEIQKTCYNIIGDLASYDDSVAKYLSDDKKLEVIVSPLIRPKSASEVKLAAMFAISKLKLHKNEIGYLQVFLECAKEIIRFINMDDNFNRKKSKDKANQVDEQDYERHLIWCIKALSKLSSYKELKETVNSVQKRLLDIFKDTNNLEVHAACLSVFSHGDVSGIFGEISDKVIKVFKSSKNSLVHRKTFKLFLSINELSKNGLISQYFTDDDDFKEIIKSANNNKSGKSDYKLLALAVLLLSYFWNTKYIKIMEAYSEIVYGIIKKEFLSISVDEKYDHMDALKIACFSFMDNIRSSLAEGVITTIQVMGIAKSILAVIDTYCGYEYAKKNKKNPLLKKNIIAIFKFIESTYKDFESDMKRKFIMALLKLSIRYYDLDPICETYHIDITKLNLMQDVLPGPSTVPPMFLELNEKVVKRKDFGYLLNFICVRAEEFTAYPEGVLNGLLIESILMILIFYDKDKDSGLIQRALEALFSISIQRVECLCKRILELYALDVITSKVAGFIDNVQILEMFCKAILSLLSFKGLCTQERLNSVKFMLKKAKDKLTEPGLKKDIDTFIRENNILTAGPTIKITKDFSEKKPIRVCSGLNDPGKGRSSIKSYEIISKDTYETLEESLKAAGCKNIESLLESSREVATYLKKQGKLEELGKEKKANITQADAMALTIYTYDNGKGNFEDNPYRILNKTLVERDTKTAMKIRGYVLRLLAALRKLPAYSDTETLYRAVTNISSNYKQVGNVITWPAFTSTSSDERSVIDFLDDIAVDGKKYILEITGCFNNAHRIRDFSFHASEDEILFEPDTEIKIDKVEPDPKVDGVTRIHVNIQKTKPVLADVVENFMKMCEKNIDKENPKENHDAKKEGAAYKGPVVPKDEWRGFWSDVEKSQKEYMSLKRALEFMKEGNLREMLVDGYKRAIIDDDYCDGAEMMKGYEISVEEGAALYSCTHKYGEEGSPSWAINRMVSEWTRNREGRIDPHGTNYLLHVASSLEKLPLWGASMDDNKLDDDEPRETKRIYLCMKKEDLKELECGKEYVIGSVFAGSVERPSAGKGECVVCVEDAQNLCVREVGPLSAWNKIGYVLGLPGAHIAVKFIPPSLNDDEKNGVIIRAVPMSPEEKSERDACIKHFISLLPLPEGWSVETDDDTGRIFYQNNITDEAQWARPVIEDPGFFTDLRPLPKNWIARVDPKTGRTYYANTVTKKTQWEFPQEDSSNTKWSPANTIPQNMCNDSNERLLSLFNQQPQQYANNMVMNQMQPQFPWNSQPWSNGSLPFNSPGMQYSNSVPLQSNQMSFPQSNGVFNPLQVASNPPSPAFSSFMHGSPNQAATFQAPRQLSQSLNMIPMQPQNPWGSQPQGNSNLSASFNSPIFVPQPQNSQLSQPPQQGF